MGKKRLLYLYGLMLHELSLKDMREAALRTTTRKEERKKKGTSRSVETERLRFVLRLMKTNEWIFILFVRERVWEWWRWAHSSSTRYFGVIVPISFNGISPFI